MKVGSTYSGAPSWIQYPQVPNETSVAVPGISSERLTVRRPILFTTGELMDAMTRKMVAMKSRTVPMW